MKSYMEELNEFIEIYDYINEMHNALLYKSGIENYDVYKMLYDKAFSDKVNGRLQEIFPFDWCDPDCGYDDDYLAWKNELDRAVEKVKNIVGYGND